MSTAIIADDEPLLRQSLARLLGDAWPELEIVAQARNGREAVEMFESMKPDICFLDVHMPGISGVEAARLIGRRAQLVFVTAYDEYAVEAFAHNALDYLVKPVDASRLADTVARLKERLELPHANVDTEALIEKLAAHLDKKAGGAAPLRWVHVSVGQALKLVPVAEIDFLRSEDKYTLITWRGDGGRAAEGLIRTPLKEMIEKLDPANFAQVHRSVVVNLRAVSHVTRGENETAHIHLKGRDEVLPVSRSYLHRFRQM
jgi:DNA-binding LytR/AlgR family response regulator